MTKIKLRAKPPVAEKGQVVVEYVSYYSIEMCRKFPKKIFVFGDNLKRYGNKGQSVIRGEPNAFGVVTKVEPKTNDESYFNDKDYEINTNAIYEDLKRIQKVALKGRIIVWPKDGIGSGLSEMQKRSPVTWEALQRMQLSMLGVRRTK